MNETRNIDEVICPYCGNEFNPDALSCEGREYMAICPACGKVMYIMESVEYLAQTVEDAD